MNTDQTIISDVPTTENQKQVATRSEDSGSSDDKQRDASAICTLRAVRHILVATDLTQDSLRTIHHAIRVGQHFGSRLTLLHVYQPPISFEIPGGANIETELLKDRREAEDALRAQGVSVRAAYPNCEWVFRSGGAGKSVVDVALELGADLVIISSHDHRWCNHFRRTTNAEHILRFASSPVLVVRENDDEFLYYPDQVEH
jgi:nucleotide-binding universal stress UspA family protein